MVWSENCMVWSEIVWFQIINLMVWIGSGVGQSANHYMSQCYSDLRPHMLSEGCNEFIHSRHHEKNINDCLEHITIVLPTLVLLSNSVKKYEYVFAFYIIFWLLKCWSFLYHFRDIEMSQVVESLFHRSQAFRSISHCQYHGLWCGGHTQVTWVLAGVISTLYSKNIPSLVRTLNS